MQTSFWTRLLDVLSPRHCVSCQERLTVGESVLCASCSMHLPLVSYSSFTDNPVARLFWGLFPLERAASLFYYEPLTVSAHVVHSIKYFGRSDVACMMGRQLARELSAGGFFDGIDAMVPVPLTPGRQRERGYNQSEQIARGIGFETGIPVYPHVLERTSFRDSQTHQNIYERRENVREAFRLRNGQPLQGCHVLLVDDVVTTGSTLTACATQLLAIPGIRISIATLGFAKS